ncbi:ABC transporter ATP-binding protein [Clostridium cylindrosporum]|uniref:ABC-type multidrug transport system, ATPase component n=1 Tax=Clostridium cylindrosporum DSM 605 TaxID=1121307 RepID=A0A0J8D780_CLOCY|nr:ABC transporter ATP-binding protein [Clostridium cylindrosporum]KMT21925.1 ABC-type multidrug transport system, ATPase component [Clostridium cylindrosporum DSM 605]
MKTILELKNVSKILSKKRVVDNISFKISEGEIFGFLGPNGAGKTTTIKMITGLLSIDEGEIIINGKNVKNEFEAALENVGGIIENPEMYGYLSGMDNLKLYANMHGNISIERINEIVKLVKLENRINNKVKTYSLGMRQRLGVAQALLHRPKLLILDEPTNGLDPMGIKELRQTLKNLCKSEGLSVLVSSHLLSEMELMCDRFGIIDQGKIIDFKTIGDLKKDKSQSIKTFLLDVDDSDKAIKLIKEFNNTNVSKCDDGILVKCTREETLEINKLLISEGINIYPGSVVTKTLEEEFMEVTKGSKNQII